MNSTGRPVDKVTDEELEAQGTQAHATRNYVFLHGTAEQFANHTTRMLALEQEYLRRHPKRTWQGSGGAPTKASGAVEQLKHELAGVIAQLTALADRNYGDADETQTEAFDDPIRCFLAKIADQGGRMHKLELHEAARECGLPREDLAALYNADHQLLAAQRSDRALTEKGRKFLARENSSG
jgi:Family of unknown function (DUF6158)